MLEDKSIGFAITGSFCSMEDMFFVLRTLVKQAKKVHVIVSNSVVTCDNRFYSAKDLMTKIRTISPRIITRIEEVEPFGPSTPLDALLIYPCTSNTLGKITHGINDTPVTMACKSTLRNNKPIILGIYTNDALRGSGENIMRIINTKNFYLVPMFQDDIETKPYSMIANKDKVIQTLTLALDHKQIQPIFEGGLYA